MNSLKQDALSRMPQKPYHNSNHINRVVSEIKKKKPNNILIAAGYYHDVGHNQGSENHEKRSAKIAKTKMVEYGFSKEEAKKASDAILDTVLFQSPCTELGAVLTDIDTHNFSYNWNKFKKISLKVKQEENANCSEKVWFREKVLPLLKNHTYYTISSYRSGKKSNIEKIKKEY